MCNLVQWVGATFLASLCLTVVGLNLTDFVFRLQKTATFLLGFKAFNRNGSTSYFVAGLNISTLCGLKRLSIATRSIHELNSIAVACFHIALYC